MKHFTDILFPRKCAVCGEIIPKDGLCDSCIYKLEVSEVPFTTSVNIGDTMIPCYFLYYYHRFETKRILWSIKKHNVKDTFEYLAKRLAKIITRKIFNYEGYCITSIPTTRSSFARRGYDQSEILARAIAKELGIEYRELIERKSNSSVQKWLTPDERRLNVMGKFRIKKNVSVPYSVIVVDDVLTSGSTARECSKILIEAGCKNLRCFFVASAKR